ncbi:uncharacterized protein LOC116847510 isoform X2 [Odontomachus brunneus]|nr:uncharacterized protein LOC116847510 isoform X2 [Odontomachus brunneus]XP_032678491.1 uncharacterized protein LOC116847510 isoform X2 [Odontomachus brunneus]
MLKLFDGESETICISKSAPENESTNQLSNKELTKNYSRRTQHTLKESPVLGKNQRKNRTKCLKTVSETNKEAEIVFEPIDIPEVVIDQNFDTEKTIKEKERSEKEKEATHSEHITSYNQSLYNSYTKLCARVCDEYKNVLKNVESPLSVAQRKLKKILVSLQTEHTQHNETVEESPNSKSFMSSSISGYQACTSSRDILSSTALFLKNQNAMSYPSKSNQHNKKGLNFSIDRILSINSNLWRDEKCSDITNVHNNNSKLPLKKRFLTTTPREELPTQLDDKEIIVDCNISNNIFQKYSKEIDISGSPSKKFCETDFVNMFQNLPTPSTVNRQLYRLKELESRNKQPKKSRESANPYNDVSSREHEAVQFRNRVRSQNPLEVLSSAAAFIETGHLPRKVAGNLSTDRYIPTSSNWYDLFNQQPSQLCCSQNAGPSNLNIEPAKQRHCTSQNSNCCEEKHIYHNYPNCSHEYNISQAHQNSADTTIRTTVTPGYSYLPVHYSSIANNYVSLPTNMGHTRILPLIPNHDTYPQQIDDHQRIICLQNYIQPAKYFALDNGTNVHKIPLYVKDSICQCQDCKHKSICLH